MGLSHFSILIVTLGVNDIEATFLFHIEAWHERALTVKDSRVLITNSLNRERQMVRIVYCSRLFNDNYMIAHDLLVGIN